MKLLWWLREVAIKFSAVDRIKVKTGVGEEGLISEHNLYRLIAYDGWIP